MTEIICVSGARAGKDAAAKMLKEELEKKKKRVLITYIAAPLRQICRSWYGWDSQNDDAGRAMLQYIGTDIVRAQRPDFWMDYTMGLLSMLGNDWDYVIIPDCRHANELDVERYGFQPRHIRLEGRFPPEGPAARLTPDYTLQGEAPPGQLRGDVAAIAQDLLYG
jgi:hypothetical protein